MPRKYQKGKSNRSVKNTSIWTLMKRGQFAFDGDLRTLKSFYKLEASFETNPNISNKINVSEKVEDEKSAYEENDLIKYNYWCDPRTPINRGKLGSSQPWRYKKEKGFYD